MLLEWSDAESEAHATERFEALLEAAMRTGIVSDAIIADSIARSTSLWALRENISDAQAAAGKNIKHDISVPISAIADFVEQTNEQLMPAVPGRADGRVRPSRRRESALQRLAFRRSRRRRIRSRVLALQPEINRLTHDAVVKFGGSISAEHGLGVLRRDESARYKSALEMRMMYAVKDALDPHGCMNPGKVLPPR